jgi:hypothetical protein
MAIFNEKNIVDAYYFDDEYRLIEIIYNINDQLNSYIVEVNPNNHEYNELLKSGWSVDRLAKATAEYKRQQSAAFNGAIIKQVNEQVIKQVNEQLQKNKTILDKAHRAKKETDINFLQFILDNNKNADIIFMAKIWVLENYYDKMSKDVKKLIRKETTLLGILEHICNIQ